MNQRLERRTHAGFTKRLLQRRDPPVERSNLGEKDERFCACVARGRFRQQLEGDRLGPSPFAGRKVAAGGHEATALTILTCGCGCGTQRVLTELGGDDRCAAGKRDVGRLLERCREAGVRPTRCEHAMPGGRDGVFDKFRQA